MAENTKTLQTRISLKYDSYTNWSTNNPILLAGEVAIATVPTGDTNNVSTELPAVLMKVGDGTNNYNTLPFLSAKAADVHAYAKKSEADFIAWIKNIISTEGAYDAKGSAAQALADAKAYTDALANGAVKTNTDAIAAIKDGTTIDSFADVEAELAKKQNTIPENTYDAYGAATQALTDAKAYADGKDAAIAEAKQAGTDAQDDVDAIKADYLKAADKQELQAQINTINGDGEGSVNKKVADAIDEFATNLTADNTTVDTFAELVNYVAEHGSEVTGILADIDDLKGDTHTHDNKALLDTYTQTEANLADAVAKKHEHTNKNVLDGITADKVTAWDAAEQNAKNYADGKFVKQLGAGSIGFDDDGFTEIRLKDDGLDINVHAGDLNLKTDGVVTVDYTFNTEYPELNSDKAVVYKGYVDDNFATAEQGDKADTAIQEITTTANGGLKVENNENTESGIVSVNIDIDDSVTFIFDCGDSKVTV